MVDFLLICGFFYKISLKSNQQCCFLKILIYIDFDHKRHVNNETKTTHILLDNYSLFVNEVAR